MPNAPSALKCSKPLIVLHRSNQLPAPAISGSDTTGFSPKYNQRAINSYFPSLFGGIKAARRTRRLVMNFKSIFRKLGALLLGAILITGIGLSSDATAQAQVRGVRRVVIVRP